MFKKITCYFLIPFSMMFFISPVNMRYDREVFFFTFALILCAFCEKNLWLRYLLIWCGVSMWLHPLTGKCAEFSHNVLIAYVVYRAFKYLLKEKILNIRPILIILSLVAFFNLGYGVLQKFHLDPIFGKLDYALNNGYSLSNPAVTGLMGHPLTLVILLAMISPVLFYFNPVLFLVILSGGFITGKVTGAILFMVAYLFYRFHRNFKVMALGIPILIILCNPFSSLITHHRTDIVHFTIDETLKTHPVIGNGLGSFDFSWLDTYLYADKHYLFHWTEAHNDYAEIFYMLGIIGLVLYLGFIFSKLREFYREKRTTLQVSLMTGLVVFAVSQTVYFGMHLVSLIIPALIILACLEYSYTQNGIGLTYE